MQQIRLRNSGSSGCSSAIRHRGGRAAGSLWICDSRSNTCSTNTVSGRLIPVATYPQPVIGKQNRPIYTRCMSRPYTPRVYYALEQFSECKNDFYQGEMYESGGGSPSHSAICVNLLSVVREPLTGKPCHILGSNLRLMIEHTGLRTYPDASIFCDPYQFDPEDPHLTTVTNPTLVFEVITPESESYDRGLKAESYRSLPSLKAYVFVTEKQPLVEIFERQSANSWRYTVQRGFDARFVLPVLDTEIHVADLYVNTDISCAEENS